MLYHPARVRPASDSDQDGITALGLRNWNQTHAEDPRWLTSVAEEDAIVIGFAAACLDDREPPHDSYVHVIYVADASRLRGLGRALLRLTAARLLAAGGRALWMAVPSGSPACAFWTRLGLRQIRDGIFGMLHIRTLF